MIDTPEAGQVVRVRQRRYYVEEVSYPAEGDDATVVYLSCVHNDMEGQPLGICCEKEVELEICQAEAWRDLATHGRMRSIRTLATRQPR